MMAFIGVRNSCDMAARKADLRCVASWMEQVIREEQAKLIDLVSYAPENERLAWHLLGKTVLVDTIDSAVRLGMKRPDATALVLATVAGSARYAIESGRHPAELRNAVTSPGGTTAAGLAELESAGVRAAFDDAIDAAFQRARELAEDVD